MRDQTRLRSIFLLQRFYNWLMHNVVVYSRKGCHLCDVVKETLASVQGEADFTWREVDIDGDPELRGKFNDEVPVVFIDGRKAFKHHMDGRRFLRVLKGRS
jgi:glutaredoxin